jgi:hypothetical protein
MRKALEGNDLIIHRLPAAIESTKEAIVTPVRARETASVAGGDHAEDAPRRGGWASILLFFELRAVREFTRHQV